MAENPNTITGASEEVTNSYLGETIKMPDGTNPNGKNPTGGTKRTPLDGKASLLNTINVLHSTTPFTLKQNYVNDPLNYYRGNVASASRNPSGTKIVEQLGETVVNHNMTYRATDFLFVDYYGKVPNNHMITLRRFPTPCQDNITDLTTCPLPDVGRLITYMDGEDNKMEDMFKFTAGFNWKEFKSEIQTQQNSKNGWTKLDFLGMADTSGKYARDKLVGDSAANFDPYSEHRENYTWGPIDVIDNLQTRDRGLKFEQDFSIKFRYAVRSYSGINTRAAFLDIMGNILNMITNKAPFWGGAIRYTGAGGYSGPMGDMKALANGDVSGFLKSFGNDLKNKISNLFKDGPVAAIKTVLGNAAAKMIGGNLDELGRPEKFGLHSLLTGTPTGEWHVTIGNPLNPAMMIGNLILESADVSVEGPFTADDIPSFIIVDVKLKHAMPRDKYAIQSMFNYGKGRYYGSNIDFQAKSYYRNRGAGGSGTGTNIAQTIPGNLVQGAADAASFTAETTKSVANKKYKYIESAYKTA
jgi:hypothetical protein